MSNKKQFTSKDLAVKPFTTRRINNFLDSTKNKQTYTTEQVRTLMESVLIEWDDYLTSDNPPTPTESMPTFLWHIMTIDSVLDDYHSEELDKQAEELFKYFENNPKDTPNAKQLLSLIRYHNRGDK
jgi:hypothetical protein